MMLTEKAYGKINLFLDLIGIRENGYHDIYTVMQSVSLHDKILIISFVFSNYRSVNIHVRIAQHFSHVVQYPCKVKKNRGLDNSIVRFFRTNHLKRFITLYA